jgi:hypothetical protein
MARTFNERYPVRKNRVIKYMNAMKQKGCPGRTTFYFDKTASLYRVRQGAKCKIP